MTVHRYTITKGLTKEPEDYQDAKSQPHVQVALKMRNMGKRVRQGDYILRPLLLTSLPLLSSPRCPLPTQRLTLI